MTRQLALLALCSWIGSVLVLTELTRSSRPQRVGRITAHLPGRSEPRSEPATEFLDHIAPLARDLGAALARVFGVEEDLAVRLERIHSDVEPTAFRVRQVAIAVLSAVVVAIAVLVIAPPLPLVVIMGAGAPLLVFLVQEAALARRSDAHKRAVMLELPVVSEKLGMLLSAGWSLSAAIDRITRTSSGATVSDLTRVSGRIQQGLTEEQALREWARVVDLVAVDRLVSVIALHHEATDLGRLITEEARSIRATVHRELVERIEKRSQQVWIPVTVATLVPGVLFLAVPFTAALRMFSAG